MDGTRALSLAEVEEAVGELWPQFDNKPALMRAYQAAATADDGLVLPAEFGSVLTHILYFNALWPKLERVQNSAVSRYRLQVWARLLAACNALRGPLAAIATAVNRTAHHSRCDHLPAHRCQSSEEAASFSGCCLRR